MYDTVMHDSLKAEYRRPFGAVPVGTTVRLRLALSEQNVRAHLRLWRDDGGERIIEGRSDGGFTEFSFEPRSAGLIWYYFILDTHDGARFYGARGQISAGEGALYDHQPPSWQLTVYAGAFEAPRLSGGLIYQVFPDRFRASSAPLSERMKNHIKKGRRFYAHERWDEGVIYDALPGGDDYDPCDFYGGDLAGVEEKLPKLAELGVSCIYLNPVFESPSNHRYNTSDYMNVDPMLGGNGALASLARAAKEYGIELMLDGVFSHTGDDSVYFDRRNVYGGGAYGSKESPYYEWYDFSAWPNSYRCWWGFKSLPEVDELTPSYMDYIAGVLDRYAKMGVTSWRLDVADELPDEFIAFLRRRVKANDAGATLLGEVWEDASNKRDGGARRGFVDGSELDSAMNYPFREALVDFLLNKTDAFGLALRLDALRENYPEPFFLSAMNLLGSHDTVRIETVLSGAPDRNALTRSEQAAYEPQPDGAARGRARHILALMVQMSYPGVPSIYYGDEAGLTGMADPFNRGTYPWGREDEHILSRYALITAARRSSKAMRTGLSGVMAVNRDVFAVIRTSGEDSSLTLINRSEQAQRVSVSAEEFTDGPDAGKLRLSPVLTDVLTGTRIDAADVRAGLVLAPLSGALLTGCGF